MKYFWRMLRVWWNARRSEPHDLLEISRIPFKVQLRDIDVLMHMNNGTYLTMQDLGRFDLMLRTKAQSRLDKHGFSAVVARQTISYRKSLNLGDRYLLETRLLGSDERNFYLEQRFTKDGQIHARSYVLGRFVDKNGAVSMDRVAEVLPEVTQLHDLIPDWVRAWADDARLPSTRSDVPSTWDGIDN